MNIPANLVDDFDSLHLADLTDDERSLLISYIALTRDITESNQLFEVFYFNLLHMRNSFVFNMNDTVFKTEHCPDYKSEFIAVNSQVINLISSARTLIEFLRETANRWLGNSKDKNEKYKDKYNVYIKEIYDTSFNYRLLYNLRNYMQHGYLPVSFKEGKYSFDVNQILDTPHFNIKGQLKTDVENFIEKLEIPGETIACLSLTLTIADFTVKVTDIYRKFLFYIQKSVSSIYDEVKKLIKDKPSIVCDYNETFKGYIIYDVDEHRYHCFYSKDNPNVMMSNYEKRVADIYKDEKQAYDDLYKHLTICTDVKL